MEAHTDMEAGRRPLRVVVVGAGFAGLSAARTLTTQSCPEHPIVVTVLEASASVGGRARAGQLPSGTQVELGATWFHGVRDNPVYDMAVWQGVVKDVRADPEAQKHEIDWQLHFARPGESQLMSDECNDIALAAVHKYEEVAEECIQTVQLGDSSVGDVLRRNFDEVVASKSLQGPALQVFADAWHFREKMQRTFDGFYSTDDVSLAFAREYETLEGPNMAVPGGYQALAKTLAQGLDIHFDHAVSSIQYGPAGATITCTNGAVFQADCVIVTLSLGVLQEHHHTMFEPALPKWKTDAMSAIRIGVADKLFVEFEIRPERAKDAGIWLSSHASSAPCNFSPSHVSNTHSALQTPSPEHPSVTGAHMLEGGATSGSHAALPAVSVSRLPPDVMAALPPQATGGQIEPWNLGRKLGPAQASPAAQQASGMLCLSEDSAASAATGVRQQPGVHSAANHERSSASASRQQQQDSQSKDRDSGTCVSGNSLATSSATRPRRRKHKRTIHSYAFLWPLQDPMVMGTQGHPALLLPQGFSVLDSPICVDQLMPAAQQGPFTPSAGLPSWLQGLHSIRYCPGPEWIQPSLLHEPAHSLDSNGRSKRPVDVLTDPALQYPGVNQVDGGATHVSSVLWITGKAALDMESASDEEVAQAVTSLFTLFPVPTPPGAIMPPKVLRTKWGTDPHFKGSYSYVNVSELTGEVVDTLGEPLCNDQGVPIVMFAGEATHRNFIGTVHGAFLSGCREAERLLDCWWPLSPGKQACTTSGYSDCGGDPS